MTATPTSSPQARLATTPLRIAVLGAGSVGGYYGGLLARAGHVVTLIGRNALAEAVAQNGLRIEGNDFDWHIPLAASTQPEAAQAFLAFLNSAATAHTKQRHGMTPVSPPVQTGNA